MTTPSALNPNDLSRLAELLKLHGETLRLFSDTNRSADGEMSRLTALAINIDEIAREIGQIASTLGAKEPDPTE